MPHRLLLADDSVTIQRVIELTFAEEGVDVVAVGDGQQAIDRLAAERFDIVLADVGMPGKTGYEVAAFVQSWHGLTGVPVVLLSGAFDAVDDAKVAAVGAAAVLVKPFEPQMMIATVRELLGLATAAAGGPGAATPSAGPIRAPEPAPPPRASADDYFDRLDRAFATLRPSALIPPARSGDDELIDRIARRVVEQLGDRAVRDLAADIVSRIAERLVREEIDRIKAGN